MVPDDRPDSTTGRSGAWRRRSLAAVAVVFAVVTVLVIRTRDDPGPPSSRAAAAAEGGASTSAPISGPGRSIAPTTAPPDLTTGRPYPVVTQERRVTVGLIDADAAAGTEIRITVVAPTSAATTGAGPLPLVVFAHGFDLSAGRYRPMLERVASAGYVVAAPELPGASSELTVPLDAEAIVDQPAVLRAVIDDLLTAEARDSLGVAVDGDRVGVMGHSDGGLTATALAFNASYRDPRIRAAVVLTGGTIKFPGDLFPADSPPVLAVHGTEDGVNPFTASIAVVNGVPDGTDAFLVSVEGGDHLAVFTTDPVAVDIGAIAVDFLDLELLGRDEARDALLADAAVPGRFTVRAR